MTLTCFNTETTVIQLWVSFKNSPKWLKIFIKTATHVKGLENLQKSKEKKAIKSEKRADTTRWRILEATADDIFKEYTRFIHAFRGLQQDRKSSNVSKSMLKKMDNIKFLSAVYIL